MPSNRTRATVSWCLDKGQLSFNGSQRRDVLPRLLIPAPSFNRPSAGMISETTKLLLLALKEENMRKNKTARAASGCCKLRAGEETIYLLAPGIVGQWAPLPSNQNKKRDVSRYVDDNVKRIIRKSLTFKHIKRSQSENFADVCLSTCAVNVLCYLRATNDRKTLFTQKKLIEIVVAAAKDLV